MTSLALSPTEPSPDSGVDIVPALEAGAPAAAPASQDRSAFANFGGRRPPAFVAAGRHSQRVRFLRRAIVVVCTSAIGLLIFVSMFDPLGRLKGGKLSIGGVGIEGTKVTMHEPKLSGMRRDGFAYEVKALTATQDTAAPKLLDLTKLDMKLGQSDGSTTRITAPAGHYDTEAERLDLAGDVRFHNEGHYDMAMEQAVMNLRDGELSTSRRAAVTIPGGRVEADAFLFSEQTRVLAFEGNIHSVFTQDDHPVLEQAKR